LESVTTLGPTEKCEETVTEFQWQQEFYR
jgi:hypothetical protein